MHEGIRKIETRKRGNTLGIRIFQVSLKLFGLRGTYGLLYIVCLHYLLFDRRAVGGALAYVRRRFPEHGALQRRIDVYRLFINQGKHLIDRHMAIAGHDIFHRSVVGYQRLLDLLDRSGTGVILLTAHVGNWQIALKELQNMTRTVHLVMRPEDNRAVRDSLRIGGVDENIRVISPEQELGGALEIVNALHRGDIVSIMGDRSYGFKSIDTEFLGCPAQFPFGPFSIAAATGAPLVLLLTVKTSVNSYLVDLSQIIEFPETGAGRKAERVRKGVRQFASILEAYSGQNPYQCFFFHDIWPGEESDLELKAPDGSRKRSDH